VLLRVLTCSSLVLALGCSGDNSSSTLPDTGVGPASDTGSPVPDASDDSTTDAAPPPTDSAADVADASTDAASCNGLVYCDDFESYGGAITTGQTVGPWKATVTGTLTMGVDTVRPYQGSKSLHITVPAGASVRGTLNQTAASGLVTGNNLFGRAMVYYGDTGADAGDAGYGLALGVHSWIFNAAGSSTVADGGVTMNMGGGGAKLQLNYHPPPPLTEKSVQGGTMTAGAWHCVQWEYNGSGSPPTDDGKVWVDGTLAVEAPASEGWNFATPWSTFDFGFTHYQTLTNPVDIYLDTFALDGAMVGCP
jgi:hypothetical protein